VRIMRFPVPQQTGTWQMEPKIPQRIEIEREDALGISPCLVERGASLHEVEAEVEGAEDKGDAAGAGRREASEGPKAHVRRAGCVQYRRSTIAE
jgi:hypothetical protein